MPARANSLVVSVLLHVAVFFALLSAPPIRLPERAPSEYKMAIEGREQKLFWYQFKKELPKISSNADLRPPKAETIAKQQIVASPPKAPPLRQMVWTPAPELPRQPAPELPNLLALSTKLPGKTFVAPTPTPAAARQVELPTDAPALTKATRQFTPPLLQVPKKLTEIEIPADAPQTALNTPHTFMAPVTPPAIAHEIQTTEAPPAIAIVGLNPVVQLPTTLPAVSSPAQFAAAPEIRRTGADTAGDKTGLTVPDLSVGGKSDARINLLAEAFAAPTSDRMMRESMRLARTGSTPVPKEDPLPVARPAAAMKVSGAPDPRFNGRDIYMMAIQMPNLTSYSGSWLMWYADRTARTVGLSPVSAPNAHRKVDPKYIATAVAERVEGKIQLACVIGKDGTVSNVEIVRGLDDRLNASAVEALGKWEFYPAIRDGQPVDVDVLVEIPFHLAPGKPVPY